jgi:voltage-gated potassium channel
MEKEHNLVPEDILWKRFLYRIIYRSDTKLGKLFDIILLALILLSTSIIMMESVPKLDKGFIILSWFLNG